MGFILFSLVSAILPLSFFFFFSILCNLVGKVRVGSAVILRFICL